MKPRSLYAKLALTLFAIFLVIAVVFAAIILRSTELYREEVGLRLQKEVAPHIASDRTLIERGEVDQPALESLFHDLMVINPAIELYLLDSGGEILAYSAPPGEVVRERVSLEPVETLLESEDEKLIRGDDPRNRNRQKFFSAAPLRSEDGTVQGYLYVILSSEQVDSVAERLSASQIVRTTATLALLSLLFALVAGLLTFYLLTRRLRRLNHAVERFQRSDFSVPLEDEIDTTSEDEIGRLGNAIRRMSQRIIDQVRQLKHTDELRRELVANVSHDLRTPLAALQGYLETVLVKEESRYKEQPREFLVIGRRHGE
ncbi:MAG: HAMP domain-containing protein, partial [Thermoanaerobaculia bacterium]|nr:HAMP domain-containing protein [Thermoanaerobaculia bacterium]